MFWRRKPKMKIAIDEGAFLPVRAHDTDAGLDLRSPVSVTVPAGGAVKIDTGVHIELPKRTTGFLKSKSGLNCKHGIVSEGVIDEGYTGSIVAKLYNHSDEDYNILSGDKITQLVILPVVVPREVLVKHIKAKGRGTRGERGFGSSGR
jgi:dUTP pyrophosphatase